MARLPLPRVAGIAAWSAAAVAWATTAVAIANVPDVTATAEPIVDEPVSIVPATVTTTLAPVPTMPEGGLVVLRYTPVARPEPERVVRTVVVATEGPAQATQPATTTQTTRTTSSGS